MIERGWLKKAKRVESPNFNQRPEASDVSLLVIHNISLPPGKYGGGHIERFFCNELDHSADPYFEGIEGLCVSAHCLIDRLGELTQFVSFDERAWHAGRSSFRGRSECNDFSIGIELEGTDTEAYTDRQYEVLALLSVSIMDAYPLINLERVTGHCDIAPERKTDPGPSFDWSRYRSLVERALGE